MRFTSILVAGSFAVAASAQSTTASIDPSASSVVACIDACDPTDVGCLSHCNPVPNPDMDQVIATNTCIGNCDQGDGTEAETQAYGTCVAKCITDNFYGTESGTPAPTGGSNSGGDSSSSPAETTSAGGSQATDSPSDTGSQAPTESGATPTSSGSSPSGTDSGSSPTDTSAASLFAAGPAAIFGAVAAVLAL